jgi:endonuclease/exonuclease/phosphatase family metal-dependent hydrolase
MNASTRWPVLCLASVHLVACAIEPNYLDPGGPRHAGDHTGGGSPTGGALRVVSYNLAFGREIDSAIAALQSEPLAGADLILMQEMDADGVERIAAALQLRYVYYPASVKHGRDWGNAILSRWPLLADHKLLLPHADPYTNTRRIAVGARVQVRGRPILVYSTHIATPSLGLGARLDQIQTIVDDAGDVTLAVIGGDFNTGDPGSAGQVLELLRTGRFAWASNGARGSGSRLGYRITLDYVFARGLAASGSGTFQGPAGSDHQPIWVELAP